MVQLEEIKRLEFGNTDHINALRRREKELRDAEEEAKMDTFEVTVNFSGSQTFRIKAHDEEEAKEFAQDESIDLSECDIEDVEVNKIKVL